MRRDRLIIRNGRGRGRSIDTTSIDLITEKLGIIYINKVKMAQLREYELLSELRYPVGQYRSRAGKHKRRPFVVAIQYFRGHGRVNAASVHESAMEETREQK